MCSKGKCWIRNNFIIWWYVRKAEHSWLLSQAVWRVITRWARVRNCPWPKTMLMESPAYERKLPPTSIAAIQDQAHFPSPQTLQNAPSDRFIPISHIHSPVFQKALDPVRQARQKSQAGDLIGNLAECPVRGRNGPSGFNTAQPVARRNCACASLVPRDVADLPIGSNYGS